MAFPCGCVAVGLKRSGFGFWGLLALTSRILLLDLEIRGISLGIWSEFFGNGNTVGFGLVYLDLR